LAIGSVFSDNFGVRFRLEQPSRGETFLWRSDLSAEFFELVAQHEIFEPSATQGILGLSITGDAVPDIRRLAKTKTGVFKSALNLSPKAGASATSVRSAGEAVSIANQAKEQIRRFRLDSGLSAVHLVLYCPSTIALFLGQRMNALGEVHTWERSGDGSYQPSVTISTG
jgi:hypothetical protein